MRNARVLRVGLSVASALFIAAACGSDDSNSSDVSPDAGPDASTSGGSGGTQATGGSGATAGDGNGSNGLKDGEACVLDSECANTCINGECAPASTVGGPCDGPGDVGGAGGASGNGGAGGMATAGASNSAGSAGFVGEGGLGGAGGAAAPDPGKDCGDSLVCHEGSCLLPDGEACSDNIECISTCISNVCVSKSSVDGPCDMTDDADCIDGQQCDLEGQTASCKLKLGEVCNDNAICASDACLCSDAKCSFRTCKEPNPGCRCRYSAAAENCDETSAPLDFGAADPVYCTSSEICDGAGDCINSENGTCTQGCKVTETKCLRPSSFGCLLWGASKCAKTTMTDSCTSDYDPAGSCTPFFTGCYASCTCSR